MNTKISLKTTIILIVCNIIVFAIGLLLYINASAQVPTGFKGPIYSDVQNNGYEYINVDNKIHIVPPKSGVFCFAEVKSADLAAKVIQSHLYFEDYKIAGVQESVATTSRPFFISKFWVSPIWLYISTDEEGEKHGDSAQPYFYMDGRADTYSIECQVNISPRSVMYIKAWQADLVNAAHNQ